MFSLARERLEVEALADSFPFCVIQLICMKQTKTSKNYNYFIKTDTSLFKGEWLAISGDRIIAHGKDAQKVYKDALKKYDAKSISLAKAPDEQMFLPCLAEPTFLISLKSYLDRKKA